MEIMIAVLWLGLLVLALVAWNNIPLFLLLLISALLIPFNIIMETDYSRKH